jgi:hypothetical protein
VISYELANELKDAGFPQRENKIIGLDKYGRAIIDAVDRVQVPTLSELIAACPDGIILECHDDRAYAYENSGVAFKSRHSHVGSTPEEAVARLWLALNKK